MIRVNDFDVALRFYVDGLGMKVLDRFDIESRRVTLLFIGYGGYAEGGLLELTRGWDADGPYSHGTGYGHISIGVPDIAAMVAKLEAMGVEITSRPKALMAGGPSVAFVKDPDGYEIELIQTRQS
jgi:lactoylglutathione lyase